MFIDWIYSFNYSTSYYHFTTFRVCTTIMPFCFIFLGRDYISLRNFSSHVSISALITFSVHFSPYRIFISISIIALYLNTHTHAQQKIVLSVSALAISPLLIDTYRCYLICFFTPGFNTNSDGWHQDRIFLPFSSILLMICEDQAITPGIQIQQKMNFTDVQIFLEWIDACKIQYSLFSFILQPSCRIQYS